MLLRHSQAQDGTKSWPCVGADIDLEAKTISITRSIEETKKGGRGIKGPKTTRGRRSIKIDDGLVALLRGERDKHLRLIAGVPEGVAVDLSLVRLPNDALVFPAVGANLAALRCPNSVTRIFVRRARKLGFKLRFHDLRGSHETLLLDKGRAGSRRGERCGNVAQSLCWADAEGRHVGRGHHWIVDKGSAVRIGSELGRVAEPFAFSSMPSL